MTIELEADEVTFCFCIKDSFSLISGNEVDIGSPSFKLKLLARPDFLKTGIGRDFGEGEEEINFGPAYFTGVLFDKDIFAIKFNR